MSVQFQNAPLAELIAELRWGPSMPIPTSNGPLQIPLTLPRSQDEAIFMQFAMIIAQRGYGRLERLIPPGIPTPPQLPACRFRPTQVDRQSPLFQIGKGIFSANALPPDYQSWQSFRPEVRAGIDALYAAHQQAGEPLPDVSQAVVRYIDIFNEELTGGRSIAAFLRDVLGIQILLPDSIANLAQAEIEPNVTFSVPIGVGVLTMNIGKAMRGTETAALLDTSVLIQRQIGRSADEAIEALTEARGVIHDLFLSLTQPIREAMRPKS